MRDTQLIAEVVSALEKLIEMKLALSQSAPLHVSRSESLEDVRNELRSALSRAMERK
jgi:hypothetical protein